MKNLYTLFFKVCFFVVAIFSTPNVNAQTTLVKGDIAFTGFIGYGTDPGTDEFSFILLRSVAANTIIKFTENGWLRTSPTAGSFRSGEGTIQFTSLALPVGTEIRIVCSALPVATYVNGGSTVSAGSIAVLAATEGNGSPLSFSANGDQIIAYQGAFTSPTFISAIHMNVLSVLPNPAPGVPGSDPVTTTTTEWDGNFNNSSASGLPSGISSNFLTNGVDAIWIPGSIAAEVDNARFNCTGPLGTVSQIRAALYNVINWTTSNNAPGFTLPTGCNYLGVVPIKLISIKAENNNPSVLVKWAVTNQIDIALYEVQRSFDGINFDKIGAVQPKSNNTGENIDYSFIDIESLKNSAAIIYYRLKFIDANNKFTYSEIVKVSNNNVADIVINNMTNPINNKLAFSLNLKYAGQVNIQLIDANGRIVMSTQVQGRVGGNNINLPLNAAISKGVYVLQISNSVNKMVKKIYN